MESLSNGVVVGDIMHRVASYRDFDLARQAELEQLAQRFTEMKDELDTIKGDLEDERETRRSYRLRAAEAEAAIARNQFVLVLVDGDGYIFKNAFLREASESGGAHAAHQLHSEIQNYIRSNHILANGDFTVMVNVYANKAGLARTLHDAGMIVAPSQLEAFFTSFTKSQPLFHFIDCGSGKERADAKLRDTYRFFVYNCHCRHIFLACCHDNGYVAELDKYRNDAVAAPKTTLVHAAQTAREYANLPFPVARLASVFETSTILPRQQPRMNQYAQTEVFDPPPPQYTPITYAEEPTRVSHPSQVTSPPGFHPALPLRSLSQSTGAEEPPARAPSISSENKENKALTKSAPVGDPKGGVPINRAGQRIDRRMQVPTTQDQERFEARIRYRKLCNEHHLRDNCYQYNCKYDHDPIDANLKNTLRYKARGIPCQQGMKCRRLDCYYGHHCPWGTDSCTNGKCAFIKAGLHDITDLEVAKFATPTPVAQ